MAPGIEGRVRQHGDAGEFDPIEHSAGFRVTHVAAPAPPPGLTAAIDMKPELIGFIGAIGNHAVIGTDQVAHGTSHAGIGRVGSLANAVIDLIDTRRALVPADFTQARQLDRPFAVYPQFDGMHRTNGRAAAAQGALVLFPVYPPGKIFDA